MSPEARPLFAAGRWVLALVLGALALLLGMLVWEARMQDPPGGGPDAWQAGIPGGGASISLEWSLRHLDPRLERASNCELFPLPGGPGFCPDQTTTLFAPPDECEGLPELQPADLPVPGDARTGVPGPRVWRGARDDGEDFVLRSRSAAPDP